MNAMSIDKLNAPPHPGPLPRERMNHSPAPWTAQSLCFALVILPEASARGMNAMDFRALRTSRLPLPRPGGEGRGEGECAH
jgi:hypothetical protein